METVYQGRVIKATQVSDRNLKFIRTEKHVYRNESIVVILLTVVFSIIGFGLCFLVANTQPKEWAIAFISVIFFLIVWAVFKIYIMLRVNRK